MIVIFDTNVWRGNLYLKSPAAAAVRLFLKQRGARVVVPEVIQLEVEQQLAAHIKSEIDSAHRSHANLLRIFGTLKELILPTESEAIEKARGLLKSIYPNIEIVPFSFESAKASFMKIIDKQPPSRNSQEFKDGVIWADCVKLLAQDDVVLVTSDRAFFEEGSTAKGIASQLAREIEGAKHSLKLFSELSALLEEVRTAIKLEPGELVDAVHDKFGESMTSLVGNQEFELGDQPREVRYSLFATEDVRKLFLTFSIDFPCIDKSAKGRSTALLRIAGEGTYDSDLRRYSNLRTDGETLEWEASEGGTTEKRRNVRVYAEGLSFGHRTVSDQIRYPLSGDG